MGRRRSPGPRGPGRNSGSGWTPADSGMRHAAQGPLRYSLSALARPCQRLRLASLCTVGLRDPGKVRAHQALLVLIDQSRLLLVILRPGLQHSDGHRAKGVKDRC